MNRNQLLCFLLMNVEHASARSIYTSKDSQEKISKILKVSTIRNSTMNPSTRLNISAPCLCRKPGQVVESDADMCDKMAVCGIAEQV